MCDVVIEYSQRTTVEVPKAQCVYTWDLPYMYIQNMGCSFAEQQASPHVSIKELMYTRDQYMESNSLIFIPKMLEVSCFNLFIHASGR